MQQKNFMLFIVVSFLILTGWTWLQNYLRPPQPRKNETKVEAPLWAFDRLTTESQSEIITNIIAHSAPLAGSIDPVRVAMSLRLPPPLYKAPPVRLAKWEDLSLPLRKVLALVPPPLPLGPEVFATLAYFGTLKEPPVLAAETVQTVTLGNKKQHYLQVQLTTRGAGVQKLTLNKFQAADWLGRPEQTDLDLIPNDPITPSFLFYHYPDPKASHPLLALGSQSWKIDGPVPDQMADIQEVRFSTKVPGQEHLRIRKTYRLEPGTYHVGLSLEIVDERDPKGKNVDANGFRYQLAGAHGLPIEGEWYTSAFRSAVIGLVDSRNNLWRDLEDAGRISYRGGGDRVPEGNLTGDVGQSFLQYAGVMSQYFGSMIVVDDKQAAREEGGVDPRKVLAWARPTLESTELSGRITAIGADEIIFESKQKTEAFRMLPRLVEHLAKAEFKKSDMAVLSFYTAADGQKVATWIRRGSTPLSSFDDITVRVQSQEVTLRPGEKVVHRFLLYHGPVKIRLLGQMDGDGRVADDVVDRYSHTLHLRTLTDYRSAGPFGWIAQKIMWTDLIIACTNIMHWLLNYLRVFGNGFSIILLTVIVRGLMFPVSRKQAYFSVKMQELAPELKKMQEKYKNDPRAKTEATMELYRKHNVHPLGGCLPLVLQMPIFISLYFALQESIFFRLAPFLWIQNLAAPDMMVYWTESIPIISDPSNRVGPGAGMFDFFAAIFYLGPYLNLLPIIAVSLMIVQQKIMTPPPQDEQQEMQFKMMRYMMVFMGLMFYKVAAGLCIYFIASSLWGLAERRFLPKKKGNVPAAATQAPSTRGPTGKGPMSRKPGGKPPEKKETGIQKVRDWWQEVLKQARKK